MTVDAYLSRGYIFFSMEIICKNCGSVDDYSTEMKSNQNVATCNGCGKFIKNMPQGKPMLFHFGKYKGTRIDECPDYQYLIWIMTKCQLKKNVMDAIAKQANLLDERRPK